MTENVDKVENFAGQKLDEVERVLTTVDLDILDDRCDPLRSPLFINDHLRLEHLCHQHVHPAGLHRLPNKARNVEESCLEEEDIADPLVVAVVDIVLTTSVGSNSRVRNIHPLLPRPHVSYGECSVDPAVSVHDPTGHTLQLTAPSWPAQSHTYLHQAVDGVTDILSGGDEDAADDEDHHGGFVVQSEHIVVDTDRVKLQKMDESLEYVQHFDLLVSLAVRQLVGVDYKYFSQFS